MNPPPDSVTKHITLTPGGDATPNVENLVTGSAVPSKAVLNKPLAGYTAEVPRFWSAMDQGRGVSRSEPSHCWQPANVPGSGAEPRYYRQNRHQGCAGASNEGGLG